MLQIFPSIYLQIVNNDLEENCYIKVVTALLQGLHYIGFTVIDGGINKGNITYNTLRSGFIDQTGICAMTIKLKN